MSDRDSRYDSLDDDAALYRELFENAHVGIYRTTPDGEIQIANRTLIEMLGYTSMEDLRERDLERDGYHPRYARQVFKQTLEQDGRVLGFEAAWRRKDGTLIHVRENAHAVLDDDGAVLCYEGTVEDISERKRAEDALYAEKERFEITLHSIAEAVVTTDTEGQVSLMNEAAEQLTGWPRGEAIGRTMEEVVRLSRAESRAPYGDLARLVLHTGEAWELSETAILSARDGHEKTVTWSMAPIQDPREQVIGVVIVLRDISERRRMEQELARIEKLESIGILAGGIAHDFNNMLTSVLGNLTLARMVSDPDGKAIQRLDAAERAMDRARELTGQLITFARGGSPVRESVDVAALIRHTLRFALRGSEVQAELDLRGDLWPVDADPDQLGRVFANLVINADEAMAGRGVIYIGAENVTLTSASITHLDRGLYVRVSVRDTGEGIPADDQRRIFDPFYSTKEGGTGLGLATSHSIVKGHHAHLEVESRVGVGTTFHIYLPVCENEVTAEEDLAAVAGEPRILVMDDDEMVRGILDEALPLLGFRVAFAEDGAEALDAYERAMSNEGAFDAVIMDLKITGGMGGAEAVGRLRQLDPDARVVVSSGYSEDPIMAQFQEHGFDGVLRKPYKIGELGRVLQALLAD
jgi:PAS domain S-box-containing protein